MNNTHLEVEMQIDVSLPVDCAKTIVAQRFSSATLSRAEAQHYQPSNLVMGRFQ